MNAMGHQEPTTIGVQARDLAAKVADLVPGYMAMGDKGMADMAGMQMMPRPENTAPMMTGAGPFGSVEMGGMFSVMKVRRGLASGDYRDPGWYRHPPGSIAREWTGTLAGAASEATPGPSAMPAAHMPAGEVEVQVRKPGAAAGGHAHGHD